MANITIKGLPDHLYKLLKLQAEREHRSINGEAIACLERELISRKIDVDAVLAAADKLRSKLKGPPLTDEFLRKAKDDGRP